MNKLKRTVAVIICLACVAMALFSCAPRFTVTDTDKGAYIRAYVADEAFDFDPVNAYYNESVLNIVSLMFEPLFTYDSNGNIQNALVDNYSITENDETGEYKMIINLKESFWSDSTAITADDVIYAWRRILNPGNSYECAALLYDIKNAYECHNSIPDANGNTIDIYDIGISGNSRRLEIEFTKKIDYNQFIRNLTSYALCPLNEDIVKKTEDWSKKPATLACSGPFKIESVIYSQYNKRGVLETAPQLTLTRNTYYYRNADNVALSPVFPYKIILDYTMTDEQLLDAFNKTGGYSVAENGDVEHQLYFIGDIPLSLRETLVSSAKITDALSTHSYYFNLNNELFAKKEVRKALSLVIDREAIAAEIVLADAATALVPNGIFNTDSKNTSFRSQGKDLIETSVSDEAIAQAKKLLSDANITPAAYSFSISVAAYDEVHCRIAEIVAKTWKEELGFKVTVNKINAEVNDDYYKYTEETPKDINDDIYLETLCKGEFDVIALDCVSYSVNAFGMLAPFATEFSGRATMANAEGVMSTHITGYNNTEYNKLIADAFKEQDSTKKATILHNAEEMLIEDMPVMPIIFNKKAAVTSSDLKGMSSNYFVPGVFTNATIDNYLKLNYDYILESQKLAQKETA